MGRDLPGKMRGAVRPRPPLPPALPVVIIKRPKIGSHGKTIPEVVHEMVVAFKTEGHGRGAATLIQKLEDKRWSFMAEAMALAILQGGRSPTAYIRYVCRQYKDRDGRWPFASQVFALKSFNAWWPKYQKQATDTLPIPSYQATPARVAAHHRRVTDASQRQLRVHPRDGEGGGTATPLGSGDAVKGVSKPQGRGVR